MNVFRQQKKKKRMCLKAYLKYILNSGYIIDITLTSIYLSDNILKMCPKEVRKDYLKRGQKFGGGREEKN